MLAEECTCNQYIDPNKFANLNETERKELVRLIEGYVNLIENQSFNQNSNQNGRLSPMGSIAHKTLDEESTLQLKTNLEEGKQKPCVYTAHLLDASFQVSDGTKIEDLNHTNFFNAPDYPVLDPVVREDYSCSKFKVVLDADATSLHTDTLEAVKGCLRIHNKPQFASAPKVKHLWNGTSLSNCAGYVLG